MEDDRKFAKILADFGINNGYTCVTAGTGKEGLSMAVHSMPKAIILDLGLPDIDGLKVIEQLKDNIKTRHIPVHIISGKDRIKELMQHGAVGYLKKPAETKEIEKVFDKFSYILKKDINNILVIEDDDSSRKAIRELLRSSQITITNAATASDAEKLIAKKSYDCIILDLNLPDKPGMKLLKEFKDKGIDVPPIVVYTGKDLSKEEHEQLRRYTSSIIIKGVNSPTRLLDEVTLFLHSVESDLTRKSRKMIKMLHSGDKMLKNRKVLLVDDDLRNVFALSTQLEEYNMNVTLASNGEQALKKLEENKEIELVLMDIMMPVMNGYEAITKIRQIVRLKSLTIIALTAKAMAGDREKCIKVGANDYITKPIDIDQLISMMKVWLST